MCFFWGLMKVLFSFEWDKKKWDEKSFERERERELELKKMKNGVKKWMKREGEKV